MSDYDGFVSDWLGAGIVPENLQHFIAHVKANIKKTDKVVEIGCGNGIVTAALTSEGYDVVGVDRKYPPIQIPFLLMDATAGEPVPHKPIVVDWGRVPEVAEPGWSRDFFELLSERDVLIARRALCLMYSDEWTAALNDSGVRLLVIESLDGEKHRFRNSIIEAKYLESNGWKVEASGKFLTATRSKMK